MIFNVSNASGSGKLVHLNISYDPSLAGATITATNGSEVHTATADSTGLTVISGKNLGTWTVSENLQSTSVNVNTTYYGNYSASIGGDIFINVTYDNEFSGKTVTCTNGSKTLTKVASGGTIQFCVNDTGEWTISATVDSKEYSTSVTVAHGNTYNVELKVAVIVNIYSACNDTIYYISGGSHVTLCTTNSSGKGTADIANIDENTVLYSTIAKDTTNGTSAYSKKLSACVRGDDYYLMPDNVLYWFGYGSDNWTTSGYNIFTTQVGNFTKNTNSMYYITNSASSLGGCGTNTPFTSDGTKTLYLMSTLSNTGHFYVRIKTTKGRLDEGTDSTATSLAKVYSLGKPSGTNYIGFGLYAGGNHTINALWLQ